MCSFQSKKSQHFKCISFSFPRYRAPSIIPTNIKKRHRREVLVGLLLFSLILWKDWPMILYGRSLERKGTVQ